MEKNKPLKKYGLGTILIISIVTNYIAINFITDSIFSIILKFISSLAFSLTATTLLFVWIYRFIQTARKKDLDIKTENKIKKNSLIFISLTWLLIFLSVLSATLLLSKNNESRGEFLMEIKGRETPIVFSNKVFEVTDTTKSSFIESAMYDDIKDYMVINISGTNYQYCNVENDVWNSFKKADSFGTYYNKNIKNKYNCTPGQEPQYLGVECLKLARQKEEEFLTSNGYKKDWDGGFTNKNGNFPDSSISEEAETIMNDTWFQCLK